MGLIWIGLMFDSESEPLVKLGTCCSVKSETEFGDAGSVLGVLSCFSSIRTFPLESSCSGSSERLRVPFVFPKTGYELFGFISHMGTSTMSGHYVCHLRKEGR